MSKIKDKAKKPQFNKTAVKQDAMMGGDCDQYPAFSFRHLTTRTGHNFNYYGANQANTMKESKKNLYDCIEKLSQGSWMHWGSLSKLQGGLETFEFSQLTFSPKDLKLSNDDKVCVFRFKDSRIIGIRKGKCPVFHVIGYDLDHSAYNHGS